MWAAITRPIDVEKQSFEHQAGQAFAPLNKKVTEGSRQICFTELEQIAQK